MRFNLIHVFVAPRLHGFHGFAEVVETVRWGLTELGHDVTVQTNTVANDRRNIIFGYQLIPPETLNKLPPDTIIYNFEQMANVKPEQFRPPVHAAAARLQIWEYSLANMEAWASLHSKYPPIHVPVGWSPTIVRIPKRAEDIDVLFYGAPGGQRLQIFSEICNRGFVSLFVCGLYGAARDELIARSRLILNLNRLETTRVFEAVRVSYLLANSKAVICDFYGDSIIDPDFREAAAFASPDQIPALAERILTDDSLRKQLESLGPEMMRRRDIRPILQRALEQTPAL